MVPMRAKVKILQHKKNYMQTVFFSKTLKANSEPHVFEGPINFLRTNAFSDESTVFLRTTSGIVGVAGLIWLQFNIVRMTRVFRH